MSDDKEFWVEIFRTGKHTDSQGREAEYSPEFLEEAVKSFTELGQEVGFRYDTHGERGKGGGRVKAVKVLRDKLLAQFSELPGNVLEKIESGAYEFVSSGFALKRKIGGKVWPVVLDHVAILDRAAPAVKDLAPTHAYFTATAGHGDEQTQVTFTRAYLSGDVEHGDDDTEETEQFITPYPKGDPKMWEHMSMEERSREVSRLQNEAWERSQETGVHFTQAFQEVLLEAHAENQRAATEERRAFTEKLKADYPNAGEQITEKTRQFIAANPGTSYADALRTVRDANPELVDAYIIESEATQ